MSYEPAFAPQHLKLYLCIFLASLIGALIGTPLVRRLALSLGIIDKPSARKIHLEPIPLLGGLAISFIFLIVFSLFGGLRSEMWAVLCGALIILVVGLVDDIKGIPPFLKLGCQIGTCWLVLIFGTQVSFTHNPKVDIPLTFLWVVGITNAFNLLDNMDGLSVGVAAIASFFFFLLSALNGQYVIAALSAALCGSCLGFLRYNFAPAKIFMGDTGSMFVGFLLSIIGIKLRFANTEAVTFAVPIIVLGVPIFDTTLVTISRMLRGIPVSQGGKDHTSHRLVALGASHTKAVLSIYLVATALGILGIILSLLKPLLAFVLIGSLLLTMLFGIAVLERVKIES
jgi:UDP-GlcNAc:undecaprenyl-phosphate GlcNAc-1-phosphate transferase